MQYNSQNIKTKNKRINMNEIVLNENNSFTYFMIINYAYIIRKLVVGLQFRMRKLY